MALTLDQKVTWFRDAESTTAEARAAAERDRDYYDNKQLTDKERDTLKKRGQPPVVINRIKRKIDFLKGVEAQQRSDPRAYPRTPNEEQSAEAATDALRYVIDDTSYAQTRSAVWENLLIEGFGGVEVTVKERPAKPRRQALMGSTALGGQPQPEYDVKIEWFPWDRLFYDPHSRRHDFSDARYLGVVLWMDRDEAEEMFPKGKDHFARMMDEGSTESRTFDDRPQWTQWADSKRNRVRIVLMHYREEGAWHWCAFTLGAELDGGPSPYEDEDGRPECPLIMASAYVDRENNRYGVVREMIDPQDEINKRRSKLLHQLTMRQFVYEKSAFSDVRQVKAELAKPDGGVEINPGSKFELLENGDQIEGQFELLQQATNEIDLLGPNAAMAGKDPKDQSGRAIIAQQQGGYIEIGPLMDRLRDFNVRVYRQVWNRIRQFWTEERWVRVTDDERNVRFVGLNRMRPAIEVAADRLKQEGLPPEELQARLAVLAEDPRAQMPFRENAVAEMDVDIIVEDAPDSVTIQQEQFDALVKLVQAGVPIPPDALIEASQLRNKKQILDRMKGGDDPAAQQAAQQAQQLQMAGAQAEVAKVEAEAKLKTAQAVKTMAEAETPQQVEQPEPVDPLEQEAQAAQIEQTRAKTEQVRVQTQATIAKTDAEIDRSKAQAEKLRRPDPKPAAARKPSKAA